MSFIDQYAPDDMPSWPVGATPRWSSRLVETDDGTEQASSRWAHPLYRFTMPDVPRAQSTYEAVAAQWMVARGPLHTWPWRNPLDFASCAMADPNEQDPPIAATDQRFGVGDGATVDFQLAKIYARDAYLYQRRITLPVVDSVIIWAGGGIVDPSGYSVSRPGGVVTFDTAPGAGVVLRAGFLFDFEVRFENDHAFEGMVQSWAASGYAAINLVEARTC